MHSPGICYADGPDDIISYGALLDASDAMARRHEDGRKSLSICSCEKPLWRCLSQYASYSVINIKIISYCADINYLDDNKLKANEICRVVTDWPLRRCRITIDNCFRLQPEVIATNVEGSRRYRNITNDTASPSYIAAWSCCVILYISDICHVLMSMPPRLTSRNVGITGYAINFGDEKLFYAD